MRRQSEALVGFVLVAGIVLLVGGTLWLQGAELWQEVEEVEAEFREVGMIRDGNPVTFRGVRIGRVREVGVTPDGEAVRVTLRVDGDVTLPPDAAVVLAPESMFGDWQAEIVRRADFPHFTYRESPQPGVLPGYAMPDITRLTATAERISENMAELTDRVSLAFTEETARNVAQMVANIEGVTERLSELVEQQSVAFTRITDEMEHSTQEIGQAAAAARLTLQRADSLIAGEELGGILANVHTTSAHIRDLSGELAETNSEFRRMAGRIDTTFSRVERLADKLESGEGTMGRLMAEPGLADDLNTAMLQLQLLLEDVRENPRRYFRLSVF